MDGYSAKVEHQMTRLYQSLAERDRRRYAAVEVEKLGTADWSTSRSSSDVIQRLFGVEWLNWNRKKIWRQSVSDKKGGKEITKRIESATGGELQEGAERSHGW